MSFEDGPKANTAHRGAIRELVAVSGLRSRLRFRSGDTSGAIADALAAIAATRHLSTDGSLASVLFAYQMEGLLEQMLASNLPRISAVALDDLVRSIDALPRGSNVGAAFMSEKVRRNDLLLIVRPAVNRNDLMQRLTRGVPALGGNSALAEQIVDQCGGSLRGILECIAKQQSFYEAWAPRFTLPPGQFESKYKSEFEQASKRNPIIRQFTPNLPRFRWAQADRETQRAMLQNRSSGFLGGHGWPQDAVYEAIAAHYEKLTGLQRSPHASDRGQRQKMPSITFWHFQRSQLGR